MSYFEDICGNWAMLSHMFFSSSAFDGVFFGTILQIPGKFVKNTWILKN